MSGPTTFFDTADRTPPEIFDAQRAALDGTPLLAAMLEAIPSPAAIVNPDRIIVAANDRLARLAGTTRRELLGRRVGDVLRCVNRAEEPHGCGTSAACAWCGAAQALLESRLLDRASVKPCRIVREPATGTEMLNADVTCTPLDVAQTPFTMVVIQDTSDRQRRHVLERMFFHDALNAAGALQGLMDVWPELAPEEATSLAPAAARLAAHLVEEIEAHRDLLSAEDGTLTVHAAVVAPAELLSELGVLYAAHEVAEGKHLFVDVNPHAPAFESDPVLLRRVLGNLIKNALEACTPGEAVTVRHQALVDVTRFSVHNPAVMPEAARLQVFQRAFTTKGTGRGLGTYGSKLIAERHLGGTLTFTSTPGAGTVFQVDLPHRGALSLPSPGRTARA